VTGNRSNRYAATVFTGSVGLAVTARYVAAGSAAIERASGPSAATASGAHSAAATASVDRRAPRTSELSRHDDGRRGADRGDLRGAHGVEVIAELAAHVAERGGDLGVGQLLPLRRHLGAVGLALHGHRPLQAVQHDAD